MSQLPILLQVYSVRDEAEADLEATLQAIQAMGFDGVELAGLYGRSAEEIRDRLADLDLPAISAHVPLAELRADLAGTLDQYKTIGVEYIVIPYIQEDERPGTPGFDQLLQDIPRIAEAVNARDMTLLYHNHDFEFVTMDDGRYALDYIYETIPAELLQVEPDTCWIKVAGVDPVEYLAKYAHRIPVVHLKDYILEGKPANLYELIGTEVEEEEASEGTFEFKPLGEGLQDIPAVADAAKRHGAKYLVVEQDLSLDRPPLEAAETSLKYLRQHGY